jgi:alkylated DNA repair dioxygenase AlkB
LDDLFATQETGIRLAMPDANVRFYLTALTPQEADNHFSALMSETLWREEKVFVWGKWHNQPRLVAWYGDEGADYTYSGASLQPLPWTARLSALRKRIETLSGAHFNSVLLNLYRNERDYMGWHSDDEPELGEEPIIASLSLGASRTFQFKRKDKTEALKNLQLTSGSVLLMAGPTQKNWVHGIRKETRPQAPRINLTFRLVKGRKT